MENVRGGGHFLHTVEKTVENKLWISGKSARFFHRSATNGGEAANGARAAGRYTAKVLREAPKAPHEVAKTCIKARKAQPLRTEKPAHRHGSSASDRKNTAIVNKKRAQRAGNEREKSQKQLRPSHDNDEGRKPAGTDI